MRRMTLVHGWSASVAATTLLLLLPTARALAAPPEVDQVAAPGTVAAAGNVPGGPAAKPRFVIKVEKGFIDDPFALSEESHTLAVLLTDAASFARLDLIDLNTGKPRRSFDIGDPQRLFERVVFAPKDKGVVLVSRAAGNGKRSAQFFDANGKAAGHVGPVDDFGITTRDGQTFLISFAKSTASNGDTTYSIARHRPDGLSKVGRSAVYTTKKDGELVRPPLKSVEWQDGYAELVGLKPGGYDKARDIRLPDAAAVLDTLTGTIAWQADIGDVMAWAAASQLRHKLPGRSLFAVFSPDTRLFDLVDFQGRRAPITLPVPLRYYDATTLQEFEDFDDGALTFSLAIDPLHPEALARRKKDPAFLDMYRVRPDAAKSQVATGKETLRFQVEHLLRAPVDDRATTWVVGAGHAALLRKHKNFSRGGALLEVYPTETGATSK